MNEILNVLCLEDSPQDAEIMRELLIDAGYDLNMDCTAVEKEFVSLLRSLKYDLILSDFKLPGFDGFTALRWSVEICPDVPFICISGTVGEDTAVELLKKGAVDYVLKDRLERLPSAIKRALDEAKEKEARQQAKRQLRIYAETQSWLLQTNDHSEIYNLVAEKISELIGDNIVFTTILDEVSQTFRMVALKGLNVPLEQLIKTLGIDPTKKAYPLKDITKDKLNVYRSGKLVELDGGLYALSTRTIPKTVCKIAEKLLHIEHIFTMGFVWQGQHFGGLVILAQSDISIFKDTIELLVNQAVTTINRLRAEKALRESEKKLREAQEMAHLGFWKWNVKTGHVEWSEEVFKIFCLDPKKFIPQIDSILALSPWPEDHQRDTELINRAMETHSPGSYEQKFLRPDKSTGYYYSTFHGNYDENGNLISIIGTVLDITERKQAEAEIKKLNESLERRVTERTAQLEVVNKELEAFSYSVSHDLRAPLRSIHSYSKILLEEYENKLDDEGRRLCNIISSDTIRMGGLIDDILNFSKVSRSSLNPSLLDMKSMASSTFVEITGENEKARTNLKIGKLHKVYGDAHLIRLVWNNLLSNAIKYSAKKEISEISIGSQSSGNAITYFIKDNGVGFDMLYKQKLFGVFQRLHSEREFEGNGVGLAIVQRIIQRHGGKVWAEGDVDKGATFYFSLPVQEKGKKQQTKNKMQK